jgi:hypothetical protein
MHDCAAQTLTLAGPPAVLTDAVLLHLSSADLPIRVHNAMTRCRRTCNRCARMRAHLVEHLPTGAVRMTGQTGGSSMHVRFASAVAVSVCTTVSITGRCASFVHVHLRTCVPDEPCAVQARRRASMPGDAWMLIAASATAAAACAASTGSKRRRSPCSGRCGCFGPQIDERKP